MVTTLLLPLFVTAIAGVAVQQRWLKMTTALSVGREGRIIQLPALACWSSERIGGLYPIQRRCHRFTRKTFHSLRSRDDDDEENVDDEDFAVTLNGLSSATTERQQSKVNHNNQQERKMLLSSSSSLEDTATTTGTTTTSSFHDQLQHIITTITSIEVSRIGNTTTMKNPTNSIAIRPPELSPFYRRDVDDFFHKPIIHPESIAQLLQQRFHARQHRQYDTVKRLDQLLQNHHGVFVYDTPNVWTRRRIPPRAYRQERVRKRRQQQQQQTLLDTALYTLDPITCRLSQHEIHQFLEQHQQYLRNGNFQAATLVRYQAKLRGMFFNDNDSS
ncbi:hypothetical protein IV203_032103 [Nitzschia inconspicua]|uniref:Uncharacterized protein n=1 Tax=Nitzschia inconspicua TaxID=303405 RepID=A0A9K3LX39_9STRA|nr:hypothetical protein IV203_032103 [Nitzschia inconspicua]